MEVNGSKSTDNGLQSLFKFVFLTNAEIDDEEISQEDRDTLEDLDQEEILDNFKKLATHLLDVKRRNKNTEVEILRSTNKKFEKLIQKLEGEARQKIRNEQTLKVYIERLQDRVEELELQLKITPTNGSQTTRTRDTFQEIQSPKLSHARKVSEFGPKLQDVQNLKNSSVKRVQQLKKVVAQYKPPQELKTLDIVQSNPLLSGTQSQGIFRHPSVPRKIHKQKVPESASHNRRVQSYDLRKTQGQFDEVYKRACAELERGASISKALQVGSRKEATLASQSNKRIKKKTKSKIMRAKSTAKFYG